MSIWIVLFGVMVTTGFLTTEMVGKTHPGADPAFWEQACDAHEYKACTTWVGILDVKCEDGSARACLTMGKVTDAGLIVPRKPAVAALGFGRACDLGEPEACQAFVDFVGRGGDRVLANSCDQGEAVNCYFLGIVLHLGRGVPQDDDRALRVFGSSCKDGYVRSCGMAGNMYLAGQGTPVNAAKALANFEASCTGQWGESCAAAGMLYQRGTAGPPKLELAQKRFEEGCELGYQPACRYADGQGIGDPESR